MAELLLFLCGKGDNGAALLLQLRFYFPLPGLPQGTLVLGGFLGAAEDKSLVFGGDQRPGALADDLYVRDAQMFRL